MKKIIGILLTGCIFMTSPTLADAQTQGDVSLMNMRNMGAAGPAVKAARDFWKKNGTLKDESWYKHPNGFEAEFTGQGIRNFINYDQRGNWLYTIRQYGEKELPSAVRRLVKRDYYDYSITCVKEVSESEELVYVILIENEKEWKELVVHDDEVTVNKEFSK